MNIHNERCELDDLEGSFHPPNLMLYLSSFEMIFLGLFWVYSIDTLLFCNFVSFQYILNSLCNYFPQLGILFLKWTNMYLLSINLYKKYVASVFHKLAVRWETELLDEWTVCRTVSENHIRTAARQYVTHHPVTLGRSGFISSVVQGWPEWTN